MVDKKNVTNDLLILGISVTHAILILPVTAPHSDFLFHIQLKSSSKIQSNIDAV